MTRRVATGEHQKRVLLVYTELLDYRVPVFSALGEKYDLTVTHSGRPMTDANGGFTEVVLPVYGIWRFRYQSGLRELLQKYEFDTVIYFMDIAWVSTIMAFLFPPKATRRVIWGLWLTRRRFPDRIRLFLAKLSDFNVFYSTAAATEFLALGLDRSLVAVARNTVRIDNPGRCRATERDAVLVVGSLNARKRNDLTIAAFTNVAATIPTVRLIFVGEGPEKERLVRLSRESALSERIDFYPACHDQEELRRFYARAICSVSFGQAGLSVLQSFAYGVPFVTQKDAVSGGEIENIVNDVNGILCDSTQADLESALKSLLLNPARASSLGDNALRFYHEHANVSKMIEGFVCAIEGKIFSEDNILGAF